MADTQTTVITLDIQLLDAERKGATTIKLDNPKDNVNREMVSSAFQPALSNAWFLTTGGLPVLYLGDITINQSIKTKLGGEDFYVTPSSVEFGGDDISWIETPNEITATAQINVSGATIQGYNIKNFPYDLNYVIKEAQISENGLDFDITIESSDVTSTDTKSFEIVLIIQGESVNIPCTILPHS